MLISNTHIFLYCRRQIKISHTTWVSIFMQQWGNCRAMESSTNARDLEQIVRDGFSTLVCVWLQNWYSGGLYQTSAALYCGRIEPKGEEKIEVSKIIIIYEKQLRAKYNQVMHILVISLIKSYAIFRCGTYCHFESFSAILSFDKTLKVH